jgi:hypothetical protein
VLLQGLLQPSAAVGWQRNIKPCHNQGIAASMIGHLLH